ncbi:MAG: polysaccharide ABC transporter ATP-binding protein [Verrucomicrobiota bacterium]
MSTPAITLENIGKTYRIPATTSAPPPGTLIETLNNLVLGRAEKQKTWTDFWALRNISFEIQPGEVLGVIGKNGAGKSTLLKLLSRITEPSEGRIQIRGRSASLLEVGTGFHPELTGRENIFLNGSILGMSRQEIKSRFDAIVEFSGIAPFLDVPVKRYSSGMYVRLAFSVAAHLEPEILFVDEVLAVGDQEFQQKCLGLMKDASNSGCTVVFISHQEHVVRRLCKNGLLLEKGRLIKSGPIDELYQSYNQTQSEHDPASCYTREKIVDTPHFKSITAKTCGTPHPAEDPLELHFEVEGCGVNYLAVSVHIQDDSGLEVHHFSSEFAEKATQPGPQLSRLSCQLPPHLFNAGTYQVRCTLAVRNREIYEDISDALRFEIKHSNFSLSNSAEHEWKGVLSPAFYSWKKS